jgi:hypothetical protein
MLGVVYAKCHRSVYHYTELLYVVLVSAAILCAEVLLVVSVTLLGFTILCDIVLSVVLVQLLCFSRLCHHSVSLRRVPLH